jgi:hypothetical protein
VHDAAAGALAELRRFDDAEAAAAVIELEDLHRGDVRMHVVMLSGESRESLAATHGTYFRDASDLVRSWVAAAA